MTTERAAPIDLAEMYVLIGGVPVVALGEAGVQIGGEPPNWLLLRRAPSNAVSILRHLDGTTAAGAVLRAHDADPAVWHDLLTRLREARLLVCAGDWSFPGMSPGAFLEPERDSLVHRHGITVAKRVLQSRHDAVVVVRGSGRIATAVAACLATSGVGHVHQQPDRALRLADLPEPPPTRTAARPVALEGSASDFPPSVGLERMSPSHADGAALAANVRRVAPGVKVHQPAPHHRIDLMVLAGDGPPAPSLAAELSQQRTPHLAVRAGLTSAVVGPFVLPGRSSCLVCALRQRADLDSARPMFEEGLRQELVVPPAALVGAASALASSEALDHLDGICMPTTLDGTVEWSLGQLAPRRRSWAMHPDCGCHRSAPDGRNRESSNPRSPIPRPSARVQTQ